MDPRVREDDNRGGKAEMAPITYYVYIMASQKNGTLYVGVTNNIIMRATDHRDGKGGVFTKRNRVQRLVYFEPYTDVRDAIVREKQLKKWNRQWKISLIEKANPEWRDLWFDLNR
jgi:putative endonuclease